MKRIISFSIFGAVVGILYTQITYEVSVGSALRGMYVGTFIATLAAMFEVWLARKLWKRAFLAMPFLATLLIRTLIYTAIIVSALVSQFLVAPNEEMPLTQFLLVIEGDVIFSLVASLVFNFTFAVHELLGPKVMWNFLIGRYHRPIREERVFLFLDMVGSTRLTEQLGDITFHRMLNDFYIDLTDPVLRHKGEIHRYVGDEMVVSWPLRAGLKDANCLRCVFECQEVLSDRADTYTAAYGEVPAFRAGLHIGPVVIGEMGSAKKEFVFVGDAVNATARIEQACKSYDRTIMASGDLIGRLVLPADIDAEDLGTFEPRGRSKTLQVFALAPASG